MRFMKNLGLLLTALLLVFLMGPADIVLAAATTVEVNSGQTITLATGGSQSGIPLGIKNIPNLGPDNGVGAFTFNLSWNPDVIKVDNFTAGTIANFNIPAGIPDNTRGEVTIAGFMSGSYLTGDVTVATLKISAVGNPGYSTPIYVTITSLGDKDGNPISATPLNAPVQLSGAPPSYTLTMAANGSGSTTPAAGHHLYPTGTVVNISATPDAGWQFVNWSGDAANPNSATTTVTMNANKAVTTNFNQITCTLTVAANGSGSTIPAVGTHLYPTGTVVNIAATPDTGWQFVNWSGDVADSTSANTTVAINADKTVTANFTVAKEKTGEPILPPPSTQPQPQKDKPVELERATSDEAAAPPSPPTPPAPVGTVLNWPMICGIIAGVITAGLLVFFLVKIRAY